jgi:putative SOS response-associated peptidase YedK
MCGRFVSTIPTDRLAEIFDASIGPGTSSPGSWNIAPTMQARVVLPDPVAGRRLVGLRWGLVPPWARSDPAAKRLVNARAETVAEKPSFRASFRSRRCIVPMDGFYEWRKASGGAPPGERPRKEPYFIHRSDGQQLAVAGIWVGDPMDPVGGATFAVITTSANATVQPVHDRMPAILERSDWAVWLDPSNDDVGGLLSLLIPAEPGVVEMWRVSTAVNSARNDGPELVRPLSTLL